MLTKTKKIIFICVSRAASIPRIHFHWIEKLLTYPISTHCNNLIQRNSLEESILVKLMSNRERCLLYSMKKIKQKKNDNVYTNWQKCFVEYQEIFEK